MDNFKDLFIFEMANNHQGDLNHALQIVKNMGILTKKYNLNSCVKLQFRNYKTFIHPNYVNNGPKCGLNKHVTRFTSTALTDSEFYQILKEIKNQGMKTMVTPFDEQSVKKIVDMNVDIIKIGSPSLYDFSLMEEVSKTRKPIVISSGGCDISHIDKLVSFFDNRFNTYALMHCVSIYPTPKDKLQLNTITTFKNRYRHLMIGFSTHEEPDNIDAIKIATSLGAELFEKHVGHETDKYKLNKYSTNMEQTEKWIQSHLESKKMIGENIYRTPYEKEVSDLKILNRGVYLNKDIKKGQVINKEDIYYAFPIDDNGILISDFKEGVVADKDMIQNEALQKEYYPSTIDDAQFIYRIVHKVKGILNEANIKIPTDSKMEISHHYGLNKFYETGCFLITCFNNDEYGKKLVIMLPNQEHPMHVHRQKDETFTLLHGDININTFTKEQSLNQGDFFRIPRNTPHSFSTKNGCILEEVSTTIVNKDSYYFDSNILENRKTKLYNWRLYNLN